jgi:hypothetical protein
VVADKSADQGGAGDSISSPMRAQQNNNINRFGNNLIAENQMADSMTSMMKEDNREHKNNDEEVPNLENGIQERDNVMQAVVKLPSNGG